jgi:hypothetical protein
MIAMAKGAGKNRWTAEEIEEAIRMRLEKRTWAEISNRFGRSRMAVKDRITTEMRKRDPVAEPLSGRPGYASRDILADLDWRDILNDFEDCKRRGRGVRSGLRALDMALETLHVLTPSERRGLVQHIVDKIEEIEAR